MLFLDAIDEGTHLKGRKFVQVFLHCCHSLPDNVSSHSLQLINDLILFLDLKRLKDLDVYLVLLKKASVLVDQYLSEIS